MPILNVKLGTRRSPETTAAVAETLFDLTTRVLGKKRELTSIAIEYVDPADWIVGGRALAAQGKTSFHLVITITDETNTKDDKARYIKEVFEAMGALLGDLHEESYIHVLDARAAAYGYGGVTQERRYQRG